MLLLVFIVIVVIINYFISKGQRSGTVYQDDDTYEDLLSSYDSDEFESTWDEDEVKDRDDLLSAEFPFFYALSNIEECYDYIEPQYLKLAKKLSNQKNDSVMSAIIQLMYQDHFREFSGLPKYLQVINIKSMINEEIFVNPTNKDLSTLLDSFTMSILKDYCSKFGIKAARSKSETIKKLSETDISEDLDYTRYFKLNPNIREIHIQFGQFCKKFIEEVFDDHPIQIKNIEKKLNAEEIRASVERSVYSIQEYGYSSVIYSKNQKPLFRILGATLESWGNNVILLDNGKIAISESIYLDKWTSKRISIMNDTGSVIANFIVGDINHLKLSEMEEKPIVFLSLIDEQYWVLNYESLEEQYFDNPDNLDIYSIIDS